MGIYGLAWGVVIGACLHLMLADTQLATPEGHLLPNPGAEAARCAPGGLIDGTTRVWCSGSATQFLGQHPTGIADE